MNIQTQYHGMGGFNNWSAIDANTYDADCDQDGFFSTSPMGWGRTEAEAIEDLKDQIEDRKPLADPASAINDIRADLREIMEG